MENGAVRKEKRFYGWYIVFVCFTLMGMTMGIIFNSFGLFIKPVCEELGFTRQQLSIATTLHAIGQMAMGLFSGQVFRHYKIRQVMLVGTILVAISTASYCFANTLPQFYIISLAAGLAMGGTCMIPVSLIINHWFEEKRGSAIGIAMTGSGVGGMIFNFVLGYTIPRFGWRMSFLGCGILIAVVLIPMILMIIRDSPEEMGLNPYGSKRKTEEKSTGNKSDGVTLKEAMHLPIFWSVVVLGTVLTVNTVSLGQIAAPYLSDVGYSFSFAAMISALGMASLAAGKIILGNLYDKTGPKMGTLISGLCGIAALASLVVAELKPAILVYVICVGLGCAFDTVAFPVLTEVLFGHKDYASIYGIITFSGSMGASLSPLITSTVYDTTGTYRYAFIAFLFIHIIGTIFYVSLLPGKKGKRSKEAE